MHAPRHRLSAALATTLALLATFGVLFAGMSATATHDATGWGSNLVGATGANHQIYASALADGSGSVYVFYHDYNSGTDATNLWVAKFSTRGSSGNPVFVFTRQVNPTLPNIVRRFTWWSDPAFTSAALDGAGNLYVAWASTGFDVYVSKSADGGNSWGAPVQVSSTSANSVNTAPVLAVSPTTDRIYVAYYQLWLPATSQNVTISWSDDRGVTFPGTANLTGPNPGTARLRWHDLVTDSQGLVYVVYQALWGSESHLNFTWSADGSVWSTPARLDGGLGAWVPALAIDARDRIHVGWLDTRLAPNNEVTYWYRRTNDRGATWTFETPVSQGRFAVTNGYPDLAVSGDIVMVGWDADPPGPGAGLAYAVSADGGDVWYPEAFSHPGVAAEYPRLTADENGTFYASYRYWNEFQNYDAGMFFWDAPPSAPTITFIVRGTSSLTVTWQSSPEPDVSMYRLWRSQDGSTYTLVATFDSGTTSYADAGLANGTYWYRVTAVDWRGASSHPSAPVASTVGMTVAERFDGVQSALDELTRLVGVVQSEQATAAISTLLLILLVIVLILLILLVVRSRRPGMPQMMPPMASPPQPPMSQAMPSKPADAPNVDEL